MDLTCSVHEHTDVTLVELVVENPTRTRRRVRIDNRLEGTVLAPRQHGKPESGWDEEGVTVTIDAGEHQAIGYACRAPGVEPPATIVGSDPVTGPPTEERRAADVLTALGDPRPPQDILTGIAEDGSPAESSEVASGRHTEHGEEPARREGEPTTKATTERGDPDDESHRARTAVPPAIDAWLARTAARIENGEEVEGGPLLTLSERAERLAHRAER